MGCEIEFYIGESGIGKSTLLALGGIYEVMNIKITNTNFCLCDNFSQPIGIMQDFDNSDVTEYMFNFLKRLSDRDAGYKFNVKGGQMSLKLKKLYVTS